MVSLAERGPDRLVSRGRRNPRLQLCYGRPSGERALTWIEGKGYSHLKVDDGEGIGLAHKQTPILVPDGTFDPQTLLERFLAVAREVPPEIVAFVADRLKACPGAPAGA